MDTSKITINPNIFREYDIRGNVDTDLTSEFAFLLGRAYAGLAIENGKNNISIGYDCRNSSPSYAEALANGIVAEGLNAEILGMGPTPQLYFSLFSRNFGGGIMVTGSHNPPSMNGFKICLGQQTLSGADIQDLKARVLKIQHQAVNATPGNVTKGDIQADYINNLIENSKPHVGERKLKVVVDAGNGVGGMVGPAVLKALGAEVIELYCDPDGNFPNHHPDPTELKNIKVLRDTVIKEKADFGIGWDGDADRIGVVDEKGTPIFGDMLLLIYAREILKEKPGSTFIGDVKCSSLLFSDLKKRGANAIMWKTGHSLIKNKLRETNGDLAGEMSGHIFFKHRFYGFDDALYASARFYEVMSHFNGKCSELLQGLPKMVSTPEIRVDCAEEIKFKVAAGMQKAFENIPGVTVDTTDGARVTFNDGWGLVRASNTQPVLVMRFEAESEERLAEIQEVVQSKVEQVKQSI